MLDVERYYRVLDLDPSASPEEVHQGYLDMTWVWHPDRFVGHPRLQQKAQYKLQELNEAHECLRYKSAANGRKMGRKSKYSASPPSARHAPSPGLSKSPTQRKPGKKAPPTVNTSKAPIHFKANPIDDWLD
ncbi:DnaJ domain protein [Coleofasciculus chthonoplastes PCC 7420]|uniref:DnaJ domain protein n=1 Tax=Coleofasciculus chthonoplastes PCC 7420 TaxID=118168 RepID=B4VI28_9CYAN|nr:J domain-containing protein [Coleofasciculus chthonoplastes]EDX78360.1 DnaJ domain protein [Coleofasciculus chthonoplastes PCC 7420]